MKFFLVILCCFITSNILAQSPAAIEADLLKSFKRISYWNDQRDKDTTGAWSDSLENANNVFAKKLKNYSEKKPSFISYPFDSLSKQGPVILTSADGLFRIYSWDTWMGGTMHVFENVLQYKLAGKIVNIIDTAKSESDYIYTYEHIYTFKANSKTYYLVTYLGIYSSKDSGRGIKIFAIDNGKLNDDVKLIKTGSGMHSHLYYNYDFFSVVEIPFEKRPRITFNKTTNTISLPLVDGNNNITKKFILYKFTGQYFERVKN